MMLDNLVYSTSSLESRMQRLFDKQKTENSLVDILDFFLHQRHKNFSLLLFGALKQYTHKLLKGIFTANILGEMSTKDFILSVSTSLASSVPSTESVDSIEQPSEGSRFVPAVANYVESHFGLTEKQRRIAAAVGDVVEWNGYSLYRRPSKSFLMVSQDEMKWLTTLLNYSTADEDSKAFVRNILQITLKIRHE